MLQLDSMDVELKNRLTIYLTDILDYILSPRNSSGNYKYLLDFCKHAEDTLLKRSFRFKFPSDMLKELRLIIENSHKNGEWYFLFNTIEISLKFINDNIFNGFEYQTKFNSILAQENSGYRLQDFVFVPITNEQELKEVADAQIKQEDAVAKHIKKAVTLFSQRPDPDYENSAKEAISAVEAKLQILTNSPKEVPSDCIKKIKHPYGSALLKAIGNLYGFCSDNGGIRHANSPQGSKPMSFEDAKFILVTSSAIVNLLSDWETKGLLVIKP